MGCRKPVADHRARSGLTVRGMCLHRSQKEDVWFQQCNGIRSGRWERRQTPKHCGHDRFNWLHFRHRLSRCIVIFGNSPNSPNIFNAVLPVFVTWVGTLLAYYFGKDNYESGAQHSADLARDLTGAEKLRKIPVTSVMIPFDKKSRRRSKINQKANMLMSAYCP